MKSVDKESAERRSAELLAPAGDFETALSAFDAGADAVYCGLADFSARAFAKNLSLDELKCLVAVARARGKKVYVAFNTVLDESDLEGAVDLVSRVEEAGPDGLIVQDLGVARICRRHFPGLALHASTQLVAHNLEGVLALGELGFTRVVLARELSLDEIASIAKRCGGIELECFVHGALCYSISGLCLFGAMEKDRSGNRGKCPYCCRAAISAPGTSSAQPSASTSGFAAKAPSTIYPFSMKDLRLGEDALKLADAGVASLKIEGRMKSPLYVASATRYYRDILDGAPRSVTEADLETVFSRRTTELYFNGRVAGGVIDPDSLGHLGAPVGSVKRITRDRDGRSWLRFHTTRALERHDGLQFSTMSEGRHVGMGVGEMRTAISRAPVFEVAAGSDIEVEVPEDFPAKPGDEVYCSMSNAVKRMFPAPAFRRSDYPGPVAIDVELALAKDGVEVLKPVAFKVPMALEPSKNPEKTQGAAEKAFSKLGGTDYRLGKLTLRDPDRLFAPMSVLNDLRRDLVERLDDGRAAARRAKVEAALADSEEPSRGVSAAPARRVKLRPGQRLPPGEWDEIVVAIDAASGDEDLDAVAMQNAGDAPIRLALPVYTAEPDFNRLRVAVKRWLREGYDRWEASDLATLRMLKALGAADVTADWTLYAFNSAALAALAELGVRRTVASPENGRENLQYLAESGYDVEFLVQQSTPLFVSLHESAGETELAVFRRGGLWVTTKPVPRTFDAPAGASVRLDLSWDPQ